MMYVDPSSQYKYVARSTPNVPPSEATSTNIASDTATVSSAENVTTITVHAPPHTATHFQAPEHVQKQAALAQNAGTAAVPSSPGQAAPPAGQVAPGQAAGVPGQGLTYDGKRMRKTMQRRTVDYNSSVIRFLEARKWFKSSRNQHALQPEEIYNVDVVPPCGYIKNPMNAVTTKFVRTSTNKLRCPIFCVVWTPEGRRLVTGASSGEFTLWNGLTFNFETILQAHDRPVRSMVWSHNDQWLLTGDHGGFVKYWQSNMNNVKMYEAHKEPVRGLSFSPSDNKFASCSDDGLVKVWDFYRCAEERELKGHGADVKCVDWHPSKGLIVSGSKDSQQPVKLWDPKSGNSITTLHCHKSTVLAAKWNSNGNWLVTGSRDHLLKLFDIRMMKELQTFRGHKKEATVVAWHPVHETLFASGGSDGSLMFWLTGVDEKAGEMERAHEGIVWSLSWHPVGHILCSGSNDHTSKFWARNRPGDTMKDKYNLDIQDSQEDGESNEEGTSQTSVPALAAYDASQVIPGVGLPVTASKIVLPDSKDLDAHLYGESSKDNRKTAATKPSTTISSQFPYPPAFKQAPQIRPGSLFQGIPGLDMSNTDVQMKPESEGYKIPHLPVAPRLRLPTHHPTSRPGSQNPPSGNPPFLANHPGNRPPFVGGQIHRFDYRGPSGPNGPDPNLRPSGPFQSNQYMRFPGPHGPVGPRGGFEPHRGPDGSLVEPWAAQQHHGPRGGPLENYRPQHAPHGGPRPQNVPPDQYGQMGGLQEGPRPQGIPHGVPHGVPVNSHARPDGQHPGPKTQDIPTSQHERRDSVEGGQRQHGPKIDDGQVRGQRPPPNIHPGQRGPGDLDQPDGPHGGPGGQHESPHGGPNLNDIPPVRHGSRDGPNTRPDGLHGGPRPLLSSNPHGPRDGLFGPRPGSSDVRPDTPHGGQRPHDVPFGQRGPRDGPRGPPASPDTHAIGPYGGTRLPHNAPPGQHGPRTGQRGQRTGPPSPRDGPIFGPRTVNDSFGPRGPRPPHFQQPRLDQPQLKSPEGEKRGTSEPRENVTRRSRDSSPRDSPPVSATNHVKQERRTSDSDAPGILGDYVTHVQEMQRGRLENITGPVVGRLLGPPKPDIPRNDRPSHDQERAHGSDAGRSVARTGDRDRPEGERRVDRPPHKPSDMAYPGDRLARDRPEIGRREDRSSFDRSDMSRARDLPSFEGRPGDRPPRGSSQERSDKGQPGGRPPFDRKDSGRQSDRSFTDDEDLPAHEKPGLLPIPDLFLGRGLQSHDGQSRDQASANHRPPDRRREHGRLQDSRYDKRPENAGFGRGLREPNLPETGQENTRPGETNIKPLMSLLDAPPINLGSPPGQGGIESRGRKRSMEHEFDRPPKRIGTGDNRERQR